MIRQFKSTRKKSDGTYMALLGVKGPSACNEDFGMICHLFFHRLEYLKKDMLFPTDENSLITHFKWGGIMF